jgi:hypothetical protein
MWKQIQELMAECVWLGMEHLKIPNNMVKQISVAMFRTGHKININCYHHPPHILCGNNLVSLHSHKNVTLMKVTFAEIYNYTTCQELTLKMRLVLLLTHKFACLSCCLHHISNMSVFVY